MLPVEVVIAPEFVKFTEPPLPAVCVSAPKASVLVLTELPIDDAPALTAVPVNVCVFVPVVV